MFQNAFPRPFTYYLIVLMGDTMTMCLSIQSRTHRMMCLSNSTHPKRRFGMAEPTFQNAFLCSPNEDFGRSDERFRMLFRSTFQRFVAQIEYSRPWKVLRNILKRSSDRPKSSFGMDNFRSTFQRFVAQILYSHPWKVRRKLCSPNEDLGRRYGEQKLRDFAPTT